ncbi:MAG: tRNA lysidine(34) synthetase TilS, partial [Ignavibacteriaceae bacterium]|nr:tRNA lysidine(34) synthetase TilS [Ignavibacteriaceae bacterium]
AESKIKAHRAAQKISVEMAGRNLRYKLLEDIALNNGLNKIATAHNLNDSAETILLNIFRGTGVNGIRGIPAKNKKIIRPLLSLEKSEIYDYLKAKNLDYVEDESNHENDYQRNVVRNLILPVIKEKINPSVEKVLVRLTENLVSFQERVDDSNTDVDLNEYIKIEPGRLLLLDPLICVNKMLLLERLNLLLFEEFDVSLNHRNFYTLLALFSNQQGKKIDLGNNNEAVRERGYIEVRKSIKQRFEEINFKPGDSVKFSKNELLTNFEKEFNPEFALDKTVEFIDAGGIKSLTIRKRQNGDYFYPTGMKGRKLVSEYLVDIKLTSGAKEDVYLLLNENKIIWVIGYRLDNRFLIKNETKKILKLTLVKNE